VAPQGNEFPDSYDENPTLLRFDLQILFDRECITAPERRVEVSPRIKQEFENGRDYYKHHGQHLVVLPPGRLDQPNAEFLSWHNETVFRG